MNKLRHAPEPTNDDFVVELPSDDRMLLCDADVHPIRQAVQKVIDGEDAPLEWLTLPNADAVVVAYRELKTAARLYREHRKQRSTAFSGPMLFARPHDIRVRLLHARWKLVSLVVEGLFGDRKYRAARYWTMTRRQLVALAKSLRVHRYSRLRKHQLIYALVDKAVQ